MAASCGLLGYGQGRFGLPRYGHAASWCLVRRTGAGPHGMVRACFAARAAASPDVQVWLGQLPDTRWLRCEDARPTSPSCSVRMALLPFAYHRRSNPAGLRPAAAGGMWYERWRLHFGSGPWSHSTTLSASGPIRCRVQSVTVLRSSSRRGQAR